MATQSLAPSALPFHGRTMAIQCRSCATEMKPTIPCHPNMFSVAFWWHNNDRNASFSQSD
jgi:hypothetical protein